jgi:hypothetical protein
MQHVNTCQMNWEHEVNLYEGPGPMDIMALSSPPLPSILGAPVSNLPWHHVSWQKIFAVFLNVYWQNTLKLASADFIILSSDTVY